MTTIPVQSGILIIISQNNDGKIIYSTNTDSTEIPNTAEIVNWPVTFINTTETDYIKVFFENDITLTGGTNRYFICGSTYIQIGNDLLNSVGTQTKITIDGITNYSGLIQESQKNNIIIKNIGIISTNGSTTNNGWLCASGFAQASTNNQIINCYSTGEIPSSCGGIVGLQAARNGGQLEIYNCYSTGSIGLSAGGICGASAAFNSGSVFVQNCFSTGSIGQDAGGIFGLNAGNTIGNAVSLNCYSTGNIGAGTVGSGGIYGKGAAANGGSCQSMNCYSTGNFIANNVGGIFGELCSINDNSVCSATNCFSLGTISGSGIGGIFGANTNKFSATGASATATNCFMKSAGNIFGSSSIGITNNCGNGSGSWLDSTVNTILTTGFPLTSDVGTTWARTDGPNTPYKLISMGYCSYGRVLVQSVTLDGVYAGVPTIPAIVVGHTFKILAINGSDPSIYPTISINRSTGSIQTSTADAFTSYTIIIYDYINPYAITTFILNLAGPVPPEPSPIPAYCCPDTTNANFPLYEIKESIKDYKAINYDAHNYGKKIFNSYSDYIKYKMTRNYICQ
jgi:hypothetical protein